MRCAAVWSDGETISVDDIKESLLSVASTKKPPDRILNQNLTQGVDLQSLIGSGATHHLRLAMHAAGGTSLRPPNSSGSQVIRRSATGSASMTCRKTGMLPA